MPMQAKVHARHVHIRSPKLLVEEFRTPDVDVPCVNLSLNGHGIVSSCIPR